MACFTLVVLDFEFEVPRLQGAASPTKIVQDEHKAYALVAGAWQVRDNGGGGGALVRKCNERLSSDETEVIFGNEAYLLHRSVWEGISCVINETSTKASYKRVSPRIKSGAW